MGQLPKRKKSAATERKGVNFIRSVVEESGSIFQEITRDNDYGNDAFIELVINENVTGIMLALQIKSGKSYIKKDRCCFAATASQCRYWAEHRLPVIGVVFDPSEDRAHWINLSHYNKGRRDFSDQFISFEKREINAFDKESFESFFVPLFSRKPIRLGRERSLAWARSPDFSMHSIGVKSLFYGFCKNLSTWEVLEELLYTRIPENTTGFIPYALAHDPWHGDIVETKETTLDSGLRSLLKERMASYDNKILLALIRLIDDNGFERGSVGQSVYAIVDLVVENAPAKIASIIDNEKVESITRRCALGLYCLMMQGNSGKKLTSIKGGDKEMIEYAAILLKHLESEGFFYI